MHPWVLAGFPVVGSVNQAYFILAGEVNLFPNLYILRAVHKVTGEKSRIKEINKREKQRLY
jgi:hypothetical protein